MEAVKTDVSNSEQGDFNGGKLPDGMVPKGGRESSADSPKRKGRPLGSRNRNTPLDTGGGAENRVGNSPNPDTLENAKFLGAGFVALVELAESFVHSSCAVKVEKRLPSKLAEFKQMAAQVGLQEKDKEVMANCVEKISAKHNWLTRFGPEVVLGVVMAQYGLRQVSLMRFVENVTAPKRASGPVEVAPVETVLPETEKFPLKT